MTEQDLQEVGSEHGAQTSPAKSRTGQRESIGLEKKALPRPPLQKLILLRSLPCVSVPVQLTAVRTQPSSAVAQRAGKRGLEIALCKYLPTMLCSSDAKGHHCEDLTGLSIPSGPQHLAWLRGQITAKYTAQDLAPRASV